MPTNGGVSDSDAALFVRLVQTNVDPALVWLVPCLVGVSGCLFKKAILWSTWAREEPCTLTQGASVFPGSSCLGIKPKTPGCLVQDLTTSPSGIWSPPRAGLGPVEEPGALTQGAPVFPGSSRLGIEPKTPGWLVQDLTTSP